jgi:hypothetical protein
MQICARCLPQWPRSIPRGKSLLTRAAQCENGAFMSGRAGRRLDGRPAPAVAGQDCRRPSTAKPKASASCRKCLNPYWFNIVLRNLLIAEETPDRIRRGPPFPSQTLTGFPEVSSPRIRLCNFQNPTRSSLISKASGLGAPRVRLEMRTQFLPEHRFSPAPSPVTGRPHAPGPCASAHSRSRSWWW